MKFQIVDSIPNDYFHYTLNKQVKYIVELAYDHDFKFYFGTNNYDDNDYNSVVELIKNDYELIKQLKQLDDPVSALQDHYYYKDNMFITYGNVAKMYNFYVNNEKYINEIINLYNQLMDNNYVILQSVENKTQQYVIDMGEFMREINMYLSNLDHNMQSKHDYIMKLIDTSMSKGTYDNKEIYIMMYEFIKMLSFKYLHNSGLHREFDKTIITHELLNKLTNDHLHDLTSGYFN